MTWRKHISKDIQPFIEKLIHETSKEESIKKATDRGKAQLWLALGILSQQMHNLELKAKYLEQALKEISPRGKKEKTEEMIKAEAEVEKLISDIARGKTIKTKKGIKTNF